MTFLSPLFLWGLLALAPLAAIYFLKVRPTRKPVTALFLYQQLFTEKRSNRLLHRLRDLFSLLLLALAVSALVLALARPSFSSDPRTDLILLVDHSASMSARYRGETRLAAAQDLARDLVRALDGRQRAAVAAVADQLAWQVHLTDHPRTLLDAIDIIAPTERPLAASAIAALASDALPERQRRIILLSDGCAADWQLPTGVELLKIGAPAENVGIVTADLVRKPDGLLQLFLQIVSTFSEPQTVELVLAHEGTTVRLLPIELQPGTTTHLDSFPGRDGRWTVRLPIDDGLATDNTAYLVAAPPSPLRVAVRADPPYFFEQCVRAFERDDQLFTLSNRSGADAALSLGQPPAGVPVAVVFQPRGATAAWEVTGPALPGTIPRVRLPDHPALRYIDVEAMGFAGARAVSVPPDALVLVESQAAVPLIWQHTTTEQTIVGINLDPALDDFFLSVRFPVLVHGLMTHLTGRVEASRATYPTGSTVAVPATAPDEVTQVVGPDGAPRPPAGSRVGPLDSTGFYALSNAAGDWTAGASLLARAESRLWDPAVTATAEPVAQGRAPAYWLMTLALAVILLESLLYHRRKVG